MQTGQEEEVEEEETESVLGFNVCCLLRPVGSVPQLTSSADEDN